MLKRLGRYFHGKGIGFSHEKWPAASGVNHHIALIRDKTAVTAVDMLWIDWFSGFNMTPPQQSIHPDCLQALHKGFQPEWYAGSRLRSGVNGATPEAHTVAVWLFLAEIAFVAGDFETGVRLASDCLAAFPNDFRVQDSVFRGRFYLKNGLPKKIGCELSGLHCPFAFDQYHIVIGGGIHLCCAVWLPTPVSNAFDKKLTPFEAFNSETAQRIRQSIHDGSYSYCGKIMCHFINTYTLKPKDEAWAPFDAMFKQEQTALSRPPGVLNLSYDPTCNLSCPSCRNHRLAADREDRDRNSWITENHVLPLLRTAYQLILLGSGDPFASKACRQILSALNPRDYPYLKICLLTNGVLLTPAEWEKLGEAAGMINHISISMDAATEETYRYVRRGGDFSRLMRNLKFISQLRREGRIEFLKFGYVVQKRNHREMLDFIDFARSIGADQVYFQMMNHFGHLGKEAYEEAAIHFPSHPENAEFLEMLARVHAVAATENIGRPNPFIVTDFSGR
jgi:molybdenum cofactor biosynthesis enzyme MoaA